MFQFDLPRAILKKRAEKFDSVLLNWHYIELSVKILWIFWFIVSVYIMYVSTYGWIKMKRRWKELLLRRGRREGSEKSAREG